MINTHNNIMKKIISLITVIVLLMSTSCSKSTFTKDYWVMDTYCTVTLYEGVSKETTKIVSDILNDCEERLLIKDDSKSFFAETDNCSIPIQNDIYEILELCLKVSDLSDGKFDITIAPLSELWDIQNRKMPPEKTDIHEAKKLVDHNNIILTENSLTLLKEDTGIDIGAVGKGYAGDRAAELLKEKGFNSGLLNLGGNITVFGENPNRDDGYFIIGIKDPVNTSSVYASLKIQNTNMVTAGGYERYFEFEDQIYHHIIDPETGYPANSGIKSSTIVCENGIIADALATAIYVTGAEKGIEMLTVLKNEYPNIAAVLYTDDGNIITFNIANYEFTTYNFNGEISYYE